MQSQEPITLTLTSDSLQGFSGCNHYQAEVHIDPAQQTLSLSNISQSTNPCLNIHFTQQDLDYANALKAITSYSLFNETLTFYDAQQQTRLIFSQPHPELLGLWQVSMLNNQSPASPNPLTILFKPGVVSGFSGCNYFGSDLEIVGNALFLRGGMHTNIGCNSPILALEAEYDQALKATQTYAADSNSLTFFDAQGQAIIKFARPITILDGDWSGRLNNLASDQPSLTFTITGNQIGGFAGCNLFTGTIALDFVTMRLTISDLTTTGGVCPDETIMHTQVIYLARLQASLYFDYAGNRLNLYNDSDEMLTLERK